MKKINVVGAGLAGSECALQLAKFGYKVTLWEKKKISKNEIQKTTNFAELVCSNSLRSKSIKNAAGILKKELLKCDSFLIGEANKCSLPADDALAVDRELFSQNITKLIIENENIEVKNEEYLNFKKDEIVIFCSGPLVSDQYQKEFGKYFGSKNLYYLDASAPILNFNTINMERLYYKSRHSNDDSHICIPLDEKQFNDFVEELKKAETVELNKVDKEIYFKGCQPIEVIAKTSRKVLLNGPMSPNNLEQGDSKPYACILLRKDNVISTMYNIVGFQTNIKWGEQERILRTLPGLENVEIFRYGVLHKNNFLNSPRVMSNTFQFNKNPNWFFAGQIIGVEGYIESIASAIMTAYSVNLYLKGLHYKQFPIETMMGSLANYVTNKKHKEIKPMKCNIGLLPVSNEKFEQKDDKNIYLYERSMNSLDLYINKYLNAIKLKNV